MEKFKFVDLGDDDGGVYPVIANSHLVTKNSDGNDCRFIIGRDKYDGKLFFAHTSTDSAGDSEDCNDYSCYSQYVELGNKSYHKQIAASFRSLADELEKTLDATQS